jgi:hypothetical protein
LIDILVGRNPVDLLNLSKGYEKIMKSTLAVALSTNVDKILERALTILLEFNRPLATEPIDTALVSRDVDDIKSILAKFYPRYRDLFNILLRRSDRHIEQISLLYQMRTNASLDKAIRTSALPPLAVKIAVQAVRAATNMTCYGDAKLLHSGLGFWNASPANKLALGIRVCRMHWYKTHWMQVKAVYHDKYGKDFTDKMRRQFSGVFGRLLVAMAMV